DIRANLIRWLAVDTSASSSVDPDGVRVLGARIVGPINLARVRIPFGISLIRCSIPEPMILESAEMPLIDLGGSHTAEIYGDNIIVHGNLRFGDPTWNHSRGEFTASGVVVLEGAKVDGWAFFGGGHFHYSKNPPVEMGLPKDVKPALFIT